MVKLVVLPKVLKEMKKSPFINIENENSKKTRQEPYIPPGFVQYYYMALMYGKSFTFLNKVFQ